MPGKKLVAGVKRAYSDHQTRHRSTGFGFALADSVDYLSGEAWDGLTSDQSLFLQRPYLRALERTAPENLQPRYALIYRSDKPVAAIAAQFVRLEGNRVNLKQRSSTKTGIAGKVQRGIERAKHKLGQETLQRLKAQVMVCGNLLVWGQHGVAFAADENPAELWLGVAEAIYRLRSAERISTQTDFALIKDLPEEQFSHSQPLTAFSYRSVETEPDMVLEISPNWKTFEDYQASLTSKYRKVTKGIEKDIRDGGAVVEPLQNWEQEAEQIHSLYLQVHGNAVIRPVTLPASHFPALAAAWGDRFRGTAIRQGGKLLGFVTTIKNGDTAVGYYIGFDRAANADLPIYFRLLQATIADAIAFGCRRLSLGRTALEPKAKLGAKPQALRVWVRHRVPALNLLIAPLLTAIPHAEAPERNPFQ